MMSQIDSTAYCVLREEYPDKSFVTRAAEIGFERPASLGDVVSFEARIHNVGNTSIQVEVAGSANGTPFCSALMTYVNVGTDGKKAPI
jgi:acyl-CoA hydrolase